MPVKSGDGDGDGEAWDKNHRKQETKIMKHAIKSIGDGGISSEVAKAAAMDKHGMKSIGEMTVATAMAEHAMSTVNDEE